MTPELHRLNRDFEWRPSDRQPRLLRPEQVRIYDELGFVVVEDAFTPAELQPVIEACDEFEARATEHLSGLTSGTSFISRMGDITFTTHLVQRSSTLRQFAASPFFCDLAYDLVGPDVRLYWDQAVYKKPHAKEPFPWHQDNGYLFVEPQQYLTCWVALTDANESNGCVWVAAGEHRNGTLAHKTNELGHWCFETEPSSALPVPVRAGSVIAFSAITPHQTGANVTGRTRKAYILQYAPEGAYGLTVDEDGSLRKRPANVPGRQFPILVNGARVDPDSRATATTGEK